MTDKMENDAFRARMAAARADLSGPDLAHQSLGRSLSAEETALAGALMDIYQGGDHAPDAVARALSERGVTAPGSGRTDWDAALLEAELRQANESLDAAYQAAGYGA